MSRLKSGPTSQSKAPVLESGIKLLKQLTEDAKAISYSNGEVFIAPREGPVAVIDFSTAQQL